MKKHFFWMVIIIAFTSLNVNAQSKKKIREHKVVSETVYTTKTVNGKEVQIKDSYEEYDKNGNVVLKIEYNKEGAVKKTEKYKYNANKDKIEEIEYDGTGKLKSHFTYVYNSSGERIGEIEYDAAGKIIKQSLTTYDSKGFKVEKRIYDGDKKLIAVKKYTYAKR